MSTVKFIYWCPDRASAGEGQQFAHVHVLVGYNQRSITNYQEMAALLRETFPQAKDGEVHCERVRTSGSFDGFTLLTWNASIPGQAYPGWTESTIENGRGGPEYQW